MLPSLVYNFHTCGLWMSHLSRWGRTSYKVRRKIVGQKDKSVGWWSSDVCFWRRYVCCILLMWGLWIFPSCFFLEEESRKMIIAQRFCQSEPYYLAPSDPTVGLGGDFHSQHGVNAGRFQTTVYNRRFSFSFSLDEPIEPLMVQSHLCPPRAILTTNSSSLLSDNNPFMYRNVLMK